jgi:hypothetical protein
MWSNKRSLFAKENQMGNNLNREPKKQDKTTPLQTTIKGIDIPNNPESNGIKGKRKELIKQTRDKILNIERANEEVGRECIVCGNAVKKNQPFRALPKDENCKQQRFYHIRTCGPGSENWKAFKANGKKAPEKTLATGQLSFKWKGTTK